MAAAAAGALGRLEEEALRRKERLNALREKTGRKAKEESEPKGKHRKEEEGEPERHRELKLRNYVPQDEELKKRKVPQARPASVEERVKDQLEAAKPEPIIEEVDLANLAPRKPDWDLKRDVAKKLDKLEKRTQRAIAELIRERLTGPDAVPRPPCGPPQVDPSKPIPVTFTVQETVCRKSDNPVPDRCDFKKKGVRLPLGTERARSAPVWESGSVPGSG
uniref:Coiled-coil domain containing 12 n=1 Tax=Ornithorhynchus anatinus TaxID=9258 RepID=A0A6I8N476_ORNAN